MATHSSILAWKIPWTEEPGGLQSTVCFFGHFISMDLWWSKAIIRNLDSRSRWRVNTYLAFPQKKKKYIKNPKSGHWGSSDTQPQLTSHLSLWPPPPALDTVTGIIYPADAQRHLASRKGGLVFRCLHTPNWAHRLDWHCWSTWRRKWKGWRKFVFGRFGTPLSGSQVGAGGSCQRTEGSESPKPWAFSAIHQSWQRGLAAD